MNIEKFLVELQDLGVSLSVQSGKLKSQGIKGALTPDLQLRIRDHKEAIIDFLSHMLDDGRVQAIARAPRDFPLPLSFSQQRLWFIDQLERGSATYNIATAVRLTGRLDVAALTRALNEIVRRHDVLRTTFVAVDGMPAQVVAPELVLTVPVKDLSGTPHGKHDSHAQWLALDEARTPFDLESGPLIRASLIKLSTEEHLALFTVHHIVADGWSMGVLVNELAAIYGAFVEGRPMTLPELDIQYADFANWQRAWLKDEVLDAQLRYWKDKLAGAPTLLALPIDRQRPALQRHAGATHFFSIPARTAAGLRALSGAAQATLFMTLAAAFNVLLARCTGQDDICVGTVVANRNRTDVEPLIGFFANTLVLRTRIEGNPRFTEVLDQLRATSLEAYAHQDMPFEQLVEALKVPRNTSHAPLFQVSFALQNAHANDMHLPGLRLQPVVVGGSTSKFDITLMMTENGATLDAALEYDVDLFDLGTIERMAGQFARLLDGVVAAPDSRIFDLPLLDDAQTREILALSNPRVVAAVEHETLHQAFESQVGNTPDRVAVVCDDRQLSYAELNEHANRLAHFLRVQGVGPDQLVGLCVERSLDMIVGLLAILKAGGAYVPLDPANPVERLAHMIEDARPALLLTQGHIVQDMPQLTALPGLRIICLDAERSALASLSGDNLPGRALPGNLAYVIYTSGSTGRPKGAALQHNNVLRLFAQTEPWFRFGADDTWSLFHSFAFDFSVWEIWGALLHGGKLVVVPYDVSRSPQEFRALLAREKVTVLNQTPSAFQQLMEVDLADGAPASLSLRQVIFGGEALNRAALESWIAAHGLDRPALVNMYGITETTVHVTYARLQSGSPAPRSVGRPIPDLGVYILDAQMNPVPMGVVGELHVAGAGLARGYLNRPGLTAQRFVPNPFSPVPGSRMYKSGDLARYLPDGEIEYLGRADTQVKLRGFRIETGEAEAALARLPGIRHAVVIGHEDERGEKSLAAYVVAEPARSPVVGGQVRHPLPNGMAIACQNAEVAEFLYEEIFEDNSYLRHGIVLGEDACVFDVGAHVGMFSMFVGNGHPRRTVYAFEPTPASFRLLAINAGLYGDNIRALNCGLSSRRQEVEFVYYPNAPLMSGRYADAAADSGLISSFLHNHNGVTDADAAPSAALEAERHVCELRTISDVFDEHGIDCLDLLKIDVEKSELDVLEGIRAAHWPRVRQVVVEVHDIDGRLDRIVGLLAGHGFSCSVEQEKRLVGTSLHNVYAVRPAPERTPPAAVAGSGAVYTAPWSPASLHQALQRELPDYMVPAHICVLESLPLTGNGKVDRKALPAIDAGRASAAFVAPRTPVEEAVAGVWRMVLKLDRVGADDNFFELGGHSLRATVVLAHLNRMFDVGLGIRALFEAPTVAGLARHVEAAQGQRRGALPPLERVPAAAAYAISAAQRRLWLLHKLDPANTAHHGMALLELPPQIGRAALERALGAVVERHEVLRTVFREGDGVLPQQVIEPARPVRLEEIPLGSAQALDDHVRRFVARPFDFAQGPLFRVEMLHTWDGRRLLLSCMHEVVADGSSTAVLQHEVMALLQADLQGHAPRLPGLPVQYKDFAAWQNGLLRGAAGEAARQYWHELLGTGLPRLQLPFDAAPTLSTPNRGARYHFSLSGEGFGRLKDLCLKQGVTPFMLIQASLSVLLARLTGQRDISMVTPVAGRDAAELQPLIGFFLNTLLLRTQVQPDESFADLLARVREATLLALQHQHYPFEQLIEELNLPRPANQFPVTPVLFNLLSFRDRSTPYHVPPAAHRPLDQDTKIELELTVQEHADVLAFECDYRSALFKQETIEYLMQQWLGLIEQIVRAPRTAVGAFALFDGPAAAALESPYLRFAGALPTPAAPLPVLARLQQVTAAAPDAVALEWRDWQWSYARLDAESNRVARRLHELGLARGDVVGLLLDDPLAHIAAVIGAMKAGGVFVTFDPADPAARLRLLVEAATPDWWIAEPSAAEAIEGLAGQLAAPPRGIWIAEGMPPVGFAALGEDARPVDVQIDPADPCYIFFTSGSTGTPKPILGQTQSLAHFIAWEIAAFQLDASVRVSQLTAPTFDAFLRDLFVPLCAGGTLCLPQSRRIAPDRLIDWLEQARVSLVHCVPSVLRNVLGYLQQDTGAAVAARLPSLQRICLSGEVLLPATVQSWQSRFGARIELVNFYGASETTMIRCFHRITVADVERGFIPVGKSIADTQVIVLDAAGVPCAPGTPGEIFIRSPFFTLGYYRSPAASAAVFVPNPLRPQDTGRVYRTGDMGLFLPDGSLRFLGRSDGQVKVNGVRVEIGEIENALLSHPEVIEAAVVARTAADGATSLHAYVVADAPLSVPLRGFLAERVAATAIPQSFTELDALPMTGSGKVDRKALSEREAPAVAASATACAAPVGATEKTLVALYGEVLQRGDVGMHDDFFALGGHSLRALLLLSRIRQSFGVDVALRILFEAPTAAQMARVVDGLVESAPRQDTVMESLLAEVHGELASMLQATGQGG